MPSSSNKPPFLSSSFRPYSLFLVLLFVVPLAVILVVVCTLGDATSYQWTRRVGSQFFGATDPPSSSSPKIVSYFIFYIDVSWNQVIHGLSFCNIN